MPTSTTFPNGQTLVSSALTPNDINSLLQPLLCQMLGITANLSVGAVLTEGSNQVQVTDTTGLADGYEITDNGYGLGGFGEGGFGLGGNIPQGTVITAIVAGVVYMSNAATGATSEIVFVSSPASNTAVRVSWQTSGSPAWTIGDDVLFFECVLVDDDYDKTLDEWLTPNDDTTVTRTRAYTRVWNIHIVGRGPNAFDRVRLVKSALYLDFVHDTLATSNLYLIPKLAASIRSPELFEGRWWEVTNQSFRMNEFVTETMNINTVASVEVIVEDSTGVLLDFTVEGNNT